MYKGSTFFDRTALQAHSRALFFHTFPIYSDLSLFFFTADALRCRLNLELAFILKL